MSESVGFFVARHYGNVPGLWFGSTSCHLHVNFNLCVFSDCFYSLALRSGRSGFLYTRRVYVIEGNALQSKTLKRMALGAGMPEF